MFNIVSSMTKGDIHVSRYAKSPVYSYMGFMLVVTSPLVYFKLVYCRLSQGFLLEYALEKSGKYSVLDKELNVNPYIPMILIQFSHNLGKSKY